MQARRGDVRTARHAGSIRAPSWPPSYTAHLPLSARHFFSLAAMQIDRDAVSISRARSVSRASKHGSTVSRSQSLIKKSIAPHDLRPSDILIERFTAWKIIVKQLIAYFEGIADIQNNVAREMTKLAGVIQVPFRSGNQFLGEAGLQVRAWASYSTTCVIMSGTGYLLRYTRQNTRDRR